ncbi:MAG: SDR family NAD(P)-dependent oxidoreductase [Pseudomonadota bacterium]
MTRAALTGRHALVTGGGTGIGLAIAGALAGAGAEVTIAGRGKTALETAANGNHRLHPLQMDVLDETSIVNGVAAATTARGPIQICVANAGIAQGRTFMRMDRTFWDRMLDTNLTGAFLTIREAMKSMLTTDWGRVLTIASIAGVRGLRGAAAYTASKHGMIGLTRALSEEYLHDPITFNAICPGYVDTPIVERNTVAISQATGVSENEARMSMIKANRHRRLIAPEEIAAAALWLCMPGSDSVNGQTIRIAGGQV